MLQHHNIKLKKTMVGKEIDFKILVMNEVNYKVITPSPHLPNIICAHLSMKVR
jgi:hypothetical protein